MVVPEEYLSGPMTITSIGFARSPMGASSVVLENFRMSLGTAAGPGLDDSFSENVAGGTTLTQVFAGASVTAADNGRGVVVFSLDSPWEYQGGDLLIDFSFSHISGSMYVWSWDSGDNLFLSATGAAAETGYAYSFPPMMVIKGEM